MKISGIKLGIIFDLVLILLVKKRLWCAVQRKYRGEGVSRPRKKLPIVDRHSLARNVV